MRAPARHVICALIAVFRDRAERYAWSVVERSVTERNAGSEAAEWTTALSALLSMQGVGSGKKQGLCGGFGGALALSSASGMTKPEGNRCVVTWGRDAWSGIGVLVVALRCHGGRLAELAEQVGHPVGVFGSGVARGQLSYCRD